MKKIRALVKGKKAGRATKPTRKTGKMQLPTKADIEIAKLGAAATMIGAGLLLLGDFLMRASESVHKAKPKQEKDEKEEKKMPVMLPDYPWVPTGKKAN